MFDKNFNRKGFNAFYQSFLNMKMIYSWDFPYNIECPCSNEPLSLISNRISKYSLVPITKRFYVGFRIEAQNWPIRNMASLSFSDVPSIAA